MSLTNKLTNLLLKQNTFKLVGALTGVHARPLSNASSISDRAFFPGYKGEFSTNLEFIYPENNSQIQCYRVMNRKGIILDANQDPKIDKDSCLRLYRVMTLLSKLDTVMYEAQRQGRISFYLTSHGESAAQLGSSFGLDPKDLVFAQYREAGVLLLRGFSIKDACHQIFGNSMGSCKGRQMPIHYGSKMLNFVTISSTIATQTSQAVGAAYSFKRKQNGLCVMTYFGDGGSSAGDVHAAMNFAAVFDVPIIFFCRNNGYAISTPVRDQYRGDGIASRGPGYGMCTIRVDGNDIFAVYNATVAARKIAVRESRPVLIEAMTYRLGHHSTSDDSTAYRSVDEMDSWNKKDNPNVRFRQYLVNQGWWNLEKDEQLMAECQKEVMDAFNATENQKRARPTEMFEEVFDKPTPNLARQREDMIVHIKKYKTEYPLELFEKF